MAIVPLACFCFRQVLGSVVGPTLGEGAVGAVQALVNHFSPQSQKLLDALARANDSAWNEIGKALNDGTMSALWGHFSSGDNKVVRQDVRQISEDIAAELKAKGETADFHKKCFEEFKNAKNEGLLSAHDLTLTRLAEGANRFKKYSDLQGLQDAGKDVAVQIAKSLQPKYRYLARLISSRPGQGTTPLIVMAFTFFFRAEVRDDEKLFRELTFDNVQQLCASFEHFQHTLDEVKSLAAAARNVGLETKEITVEILNVVRSNDSRVLSMECEIKRLAAIHKEALAQGQAEQAAVLKKLIGLLRDVDGKLQSIVATQSARESGANSVWVSDEKLKQAALQYLARFRQLSLAEQQELSALLNGIGRIQIASGDFASARRTFVEVAESENDRATRNEAQNNAHIAAIAQVTAELKAMRSQMASSGANGHPEEVSVRTQQAQYGLLLELLADLRRDIQRLKEEKNVPKPPEKDRDAVDFVGRMATWQKQQDAVNAPGPAISSSVCEDKTIPIAALATVPEAELAAPAPPKEEPTQDTSSSVCEDKTIPIPAPATVPEAELASPAPPKEEPIQDTGRPLRDTLKNTLLAIAKFVWFTVFAILGAASGTVIGAIGGSIAGLVLMIILAILGKPGGLGIVDLGEYAGVPVPVFLFFLCAAVGAIFGFFIGGGKALEIADSSSSGKIRKSLLWMGGAIGILACCCGLPVYSYVSYFVPPDVIGNWEYRETIDPLSGVGREEGLVRLVHLDHLDAASKKRLQEEAARNPWTFSARYEFNEDGTGLFDERVENRGNQEGTSGQNLYYFTYQKRVDQHHHWIEINFTHKDIEGKKMPHSGGHVIQVTRWCFFNTLKIEGGTYEFIRDSEVRNGHIGRKTLPFAKVD